MHKTELASALFLPFPFGFSAMCLYEKLPLLCIHRHHIAAEGAWYSLPTYTNYTTTQSVAANTFKPLYFFEPQTMKIYKRIPHISLKYLKYGFLYIYIYIYTYTHVSAYIRKTFARYSWKDSRSLSIKKTLFFSIIKLVSCF